MITILGFEVLFAATTGKTGNAKSDKIDFDILILQ
jgi:hypothetical protein